MNQYNIKDYFLNYHISCFKTEKKDGYLHCVLYVHAFVKGTGKKK